MGTARGDGDGALRGHHYMGVDVWIRGHMNRQTHRHMDMRINGHIDRHMDRQAHGQMDRWTHRLMDR